MVSQLNISVKTSSILQAENFKLNRRCWLGTYVGSQWVQFTKTHGSLVHNNFSNENIK